MSQALRELVVSIDFNDIDISRLTRMDRAIDSIESNVRDLGGDIDRMGNRTRTAGAEGSRALDRLGSRADGAGDAMDELGRDAARAGDRVDQAANEATQELRDMGNAGDRAAGEVRRAADQAADALRDMGNDGERAAGDIIRAGNRADDCLDQLRRTGDRAMDDLRRGADRAGDAVHDMGICDAGDCMEGAAGKGGKLLDVLGEITPDAKGAGLAALLFSNPWTAAIAAVVLALGGVGLAIAAMVNDADNAFDRMAAKAGMTADEMANMKGAALSVYSQGFGEDLTEVASDIATVKQSFRDLDQGSIEKLTAGAYVMKDLWGPEVKEVSKVVKTMTKNFKDLSEQDAMDLMTTGFQKGGDYADDLLDTVNEYSVYFSKLGIGAEQFMGTLLAGSEAGAFNLDKVGDSVKEFGIRAIDGSDATKEAFGTLGFDAKDVTKKLAAGGKDASNAFMATVSSLSFVQDKMEQNRLGVALFGTQWEDVREDVIFAMDGAEKAVEGFQGATDRASAQAYDNVSSKWTQIKHSIHAAIIDAFDFSGESSGFMSGIFDGLIGALPGITAGIQGAVDWITDIFTNNQESIGQFVSGISGLFMGLWSIVQGVWGLIGPFIQATLGGALGVVWSVAGLVLGNLGDLFNIVGKLIQGDWSGAWDAVQDYFSNSLNRLIEVGRSLLNLFFGIWDSITGRIIEAVTGIDLTQAGYDMIDGLINGVMSMKDMAVDKVKNLAKEMWGGFKDFFGIHSPSRLMMEGGVNVVQGLEIGIGKTAQDAIGAAAAMSKGVASAVTDTPEIGGIMAARSGDAATPAQTAQVSAEMSAPAPVQQTAGGITITVPVTVQAAPGMGEKEAADIGDIVGQKVNEKLAAIFSQLGLKFA